MKAAIIILLLMIGITGCTIFTEPAKLPIVRRDVAGEADILAIKAERRIIYVSGDGQVVCSEPPPDVSEAFASMINASGNATAGKDELQASAALAYQRNAANSIAMLFVRTQGIRHFRQGASDLCFAYANKAISREDYIKELDKFRNDAKDLIALELQGLTAVRTSLAATNTASPPAGNVPAQKPQ